MRMTLSAAIVATSLAVPSPAAGNETLSFIADDYPQALTAARAQGKPIFLEAWAPW